MGVVPGEGVEPSLPRGNWILNPARLPIPPSGHSRKNENVKGLPAWQPWSFQNALLSKNGEKLLA
jgi:hypothetical protein